MTMEGGTSNEGWRNPTTTTVNEDHTDYSNRTWLSLVGLLHPSEFFFTVDHSNLWNKHVTWSKPSGEDLRSYRTQRLSSNMVFLSLILSADLNVLFNSSAPCNNMRQSMTFGNFGELNYWIGSVIVFSACVTVIALVANFTVWGMLSSISEANTRALLRSNIGQYVTSLPSRFVVASLYLFLIWLVLFVVHLLDGPLQVVVVGSVVCLFFQVVVSLSAFGRLIIHTGAMGERPVLDPEFEKSLLPSGLHASLLIKATARKRRNAGVMSMYRRISCFEEEGPSNQTPIPPANSPEFSFTKMDRGRSYDSQDDTTDFSIGNDDSTTRYAAVQVADIDDLVISDEDLPNPTASLPPLPPKSTRFAEQAPKHTKQNRRSTFSHHRVLTNTDFSFPLPEILNQNGGGTKELNELLEMTLKSEECDIENNRPPYPTDKKHGSGRSRNKSKGRKKAKALNLIDEKKSAVIVDDIDEMSLKLDEMSLQIENQVGASLQEDSTMRSTDQGMDHSATRSRDEQFLASFDSVPYPQPVDVPNIFHNSESSIDSRNDKRRNSLRLHQKIQNEALKMTNKFGTARSFQKEWVEEAAVRDMYSVVPPVQLELDEERSSISTPTLRPMMNLAFSGLRSSFQRIGSPLHHDEVHVGTENAVLPGDVEPQETHYLLLNKP